MNDPIYLKLLEFVGMVESGEVILKEIKDESLYYDYKVSFIYQRIGE